MPKRFKVIDLFSGCGGSAVGFRNAGFDVQVAVDIKEKASQSFKKNFPTAHVFAKDICEISGRELLEATGATSPDEVVILGCPPCQGFSSARRTSQRLSDPRNRLLVEFLRMVKEINPIAFTMENVPGLATGVGESLFRDTLKEIHNLGYSTAFQVVNAADFGVPQRRKRLVLIGVRDPHIKVIMPEPTHINPDKANNTLHSWETVKDAISDLPPIKAGEKHISDPLHVSANLAEINLKRLMHTPKDGGDRRAWPEELVLECHKNNNGHMDVYGRMRWSIPSPTMTGGCGMISKGRYGHPEQDRAISLREAARLQTFPDDFSFVGNFGEIALQIGNAVPPLLAQRIAEALIKNINLVLNQNKDTHVTSEDIASLQVLR